MIRSMTGYGEAERESPAGRLRLEVKTVNHRFFNTSIKTPSGFDKFEREIAEALKRYLSRGHISAFLTIDRSSKAHDSTPTVDLTRAKQLRAALEALQSDLDIPGEVDLAMLARFSELFRAPEQEWTEGVASDLVRAVAEDAGRAAQAFREAEGERLRADLEGRLSAMTEALDRVVDAVECLTDGCERLMHRALENRDQQVVLAPEVQIHGAGSHAGLPRDVGDLGVEEPSPGEQRGGGLEDQVTLLTRVLRPRHATDGSCSRHGCMK